MKPLAVTVGDPAGIGPEVVARAVASLPSPVPLILCGDLELTRQSLMRAGIPFAFRVASKDEASAHETGVIFLPSSDGSDESPLEMGRPTARSGAAALSAIEAAISLVENDVCDAIVTAPISKHAIQLAGSEFPGHTELLADRAGLRRYGEDFAMMFESPRLRVALLSVHLSLRQAIDSIDTSRILALGRLLDRELTRVLGVKPRIAVAGLNPHGGEEGRFGDEEMLVQEAVDQLRSAGIHASGPFAADTVFLRSVRKECEVVIALYHDQGLIPVKTLDFQESVNVTLGLPYLRASVDHGTAFDIAGKGIADAEPMRYAIRWTAENVDRWTR